MSANIPRVKVSFALQRFYDLITAATTPLQVIGLFKDMPDEHPTDHVFKHSMVNGLCAKCWWIDPHVVTDPVRDRKLLREHAQELAADIETGFEDTK